MNVLSLFDGMSCTQIALKNLGIKVDKYYASEIDKYAIKVAKENFPETIHLGDIKDIKGKDLPEIDLIVAGSPCQGFSFAGKQLAFDDPRSALFFEFVRLLKEVKPKYFLLENVRMKKEHMDVISEQVSDIYPECNNGSLFGIEPIKINSALVSAQNRNRLYWTNIPNIEQPKDIGLVLRDVLEDFPTKEHYAGEELQKNYKGGNQLNPNYKSQANTIHNIDEKSATISAGTHGYANGYVHDKDLEWVKTPQYLKNELYGVPRGEYVKGVDEKSNTLNATMYKGQISSYVKRRDEDLKKMTTKEGKAFVLTASYQGAASWNSIERKQRTMIPTYDTPKQVGTATDINGYDIIKRVYSEDGKSPTLTTMGGGHREPKVAVTSYREVRTKEAKEERKKIRKETGKDHTPFRAKELVPREDGKVGTLTPSLNKDHTISVKGGALRARSKNKEGKNVEWKKTKPQQMLELRKDDKSNSLTSSTKDSLAVKEEELTWRKLTPLECERLQTVPDNYTAAVSNTQRYKMLGNGFTVKVIEHILTNMEK